MKFKRLKFCLKDEKAMIVSIQFDEDHCFCKTFNKTLSNSRLRTDY